MDPTLRVGAVRSRVQSLEFQHSCSASTTLSSNVVLDFRWCAMPFVFRQGTALQNKLFPAHPFKEDIGGQDEDSNQEVEDKREEDRNQEDRHEH